MCHTCKQSLPPVPPSMPVQQIPSFMTTPFFPMPQCTIPAPTISGVSFASCSTPSPQPPQSGALPAFHEISVTPPQPQVAYTPRHCQEQIVSMPATLSHSPSVSTPSPISASSSHKDSFQQLFDTATQSPTLSPTSSPCPVSNANSYWSDITPMLPSIPVNVSQPQDINTILSSDFSTASTGASFQLVTSPGSETVYSAVPSPDTTTPIFPSYSYMDNPSAPYPFTS